MCSGEGALLKERRGGFCFGIRVQVAFTCLWANYS